MLGSKLSADSGANTRQGLGEKLSSSRKVDHWDGINAKNPRGLGTESPEKRSSLYSQLISSFRSRIDSILSSDPCLRLQLLHEPIPLSGCRNHYSASLG